MQFQALAGEFVTNSDLCEPVFSIKSLADIPICILSPEIQNA